MDEYKNKKKYDYYFPICIGVGLTFGMIFDQLAAGLCFGVAIGLALDSKKK